VRDPAQGCLRSALAVSLLLHIGLLCSPVSLLPLRFNTDRAALQVVVAPLGRGPSKEPPRAEYSASTKQPEASRVAPPADSGRAQAKSRRSWLPGSGEHIAAGPGQDSRCDPCRRQSARTRRTPVHRTVALTIGR